MTYYNLKCSAAKPTHFFVERQQNISIEETNLKNNIKIALGESKTKKIAFLKFVHHFSRNRQIQEDKKCRLIETAYQQTAISRDYLKLVIELCKGTDSYFSQYFKSHHSQPMRNFLMDLGFSENEVHPHYFAKKLIVEHLNSTLAPVLKDENSRKTFLHFVWFACVEQKAVCLLQLEPIAKKIGLINDIETLKDVIYICKHKNKKGFLNVFKPRYTNSTKSLLSKLGYTARDWNRVSKISYENNPQECPPLFNSHKKEYNESNFESSNKALIINLSTFLQNNNNFKKAKFWARSGLFANLKGLSEDDFNKIIYYSRHRRKGLLSIFNRYYTWSLQQFLLREKGYSQDDIKNRCHLLSVHESFEKNKLTYLEEDFKKFPKEYVFPKKPAHVDYLHCQFEKFSMAEICDLSHKNTFFAQRNPLINILQSISTKPLQPISRENLVDGDFEGKDFSDFNFQKSYLAYTNFNGATLIGTNFEGAYMAASKLINAKLQNAIFKNATSQSADFKNADLHGANFERADLREANFQEAVNLRSVNFKGADLRGVNFERADLRGVNFEGADLRGVNFKRADVREVNFQGAKLQKANLWYCNITGANLQNALLDYIIFIEYAIPFTESDEDTQPDEEFDRNRFHPTKEDVAENKNSAAGILLNQRINKFLNEIECAINIMESIGKNYLLIREKIWPKILGRIKIFDRNITSLNEEERKFVNFEQMKPLKNKIELLVESFNEEMDKFNEQQRILKAREPKWARAIISKKFYFF